MGTRGDLTFPQGPGTAPGNHQPQIQLTFLLTSQKPEKKDEEHGHFFSPALKENVTQKASHTVCSYCLSFESEEREINAEDTGHATKGDVSLSKIQNYYTE